MSTKANKHEAAAAATGYLYQCRYALLVGLQAIADNPEFQLSIEKFDDVAFESDGDPVQLLQLKHHVKKAGNLANASVDLWKTLGIWLKLVESDSTTPFHRRFVLVTTGVAPVDSAASYLRSRDRNEKQAQQELLKTATQSKNEKNKEGYSAFARLSESQQLNFLDAIIIADGSPDIINVHDEICRELRHAAGKQNVKHFVERLEGWWFNLVIKALTSGASISITAIENRLDELREDFQRKTLPVDYLTANPPAAVVAELDKRPFVRQLRRIAIGSNRIEFAIRDYYRAFEQRARWAREELLVDGELDRYEQELIESWQPRFEAAKEELPKRCTDSKKVKSGQAIYAWVETEALFPLRTLLHRFLTHGSFHMLANRYALGWHPDYLEHAKLDEKDKNEDGA